MNTPTPSIPRRITVVGAGAIGGLLAARIGGNLPIRAVTLSALARGQTLQQLRQGGLNLLEPDGTRRHVKLQASDNPSELGKQDLVIVAVKGPALEEVAPAVRELLSPHTRVLVAMNGVPWWFFQGMTGRYSRLTLKSVDPKGVIAACIPAKQVVGCVVHASATTSGAAQVRHISGNGLIIGQPDGQISHELTQVDALLGQAGFEVQVSTNLQREIWFKLWGNMTMNPVSALTGATCDRILDDPLVRQFCNAVMLEAQAIGREIGCHIEQTPDERHTITRRLGAFRTSMLQDVLAGRPLEIDPLLGAVREIGQHLGIVTPNIDALLGLVRLMAQQKGLYPQSPGLAHG